jgi:hypothetical protein
MYGQTRRIEKHLFYETRRRKKKFVSQLGNMKERKRRFLGAVTSLLFRRGRPRKIRMLYMATTETRAEILTVELLLPGLPRDNIHILRIKPFGSDLFLCIPTVGI